MSNRIFEHFASTARYSGCRSNEKLLQLHTHIGRSRGHVQQCPPNGPDSFVLTYKIFKMLLPQESLPLYEVNTHSYEKSWICHCSVSKIGPLVLGLFSMKYGRFQISCEIRQMPNFMKSSRFHVRS